MNGIKDNIRKVAVYCRVSSDVQREKRTIESQVSTLRSYAERCAYEVYRIYQDDGFSGSTIEGRPALLIDCGKGKFETILVVEHNRITRSENPEEVGKIQRILMENNIRLISPPEGVLDLKRPPDEPVAWIKMWIAKEEKREMDGRPTPFRIPLRQDNQPMGLSARRAETLLVDAREVPGGEMVPNPDLCRTAKEKR